MKIRLHVEGTLLTATLDDNETARDFTSLPVADGRIGQPALFDTDDR